MARIAIFTGTMAVCMAGLGYFAARLDIWWYHLGPQQATLALWGAPLALFVVGGVWGYMTVTMDKRNRA